MTVPVFARHDVLRRIRHAEEWLRWARHDCLRGDLRGMALRLMLAEAEIRHVRETRLREALRSGAPLRPRRPRAGGVGAAVGLAAVTVVAAAISVGVPRQGAGPVGVESPASALRSSAPAWAGAVRLQTGGFLTLVQDQEVGSPWQHEVMGGLQQGMVTDLLGGTAERSGVSVMAVEAVPPPSGSGTKGRTASSGLPRAGGSPVPVRAVATPRF